MEDKIVSIESLRQTQDLLEQIKNLEKAEQRAVLWMLYHLEFLDLIDSGRVMTGEEEQRWMERARRDENYILMLLVQYKKEKDQKRV